MKVAFLGTAAVVPEGGHESTCLLIDGHLLVDAGWNAAITMRRFGCDPMAVETLLITHFHHDHYLGLPQLIYYLANKHYERPDRAPLRIAGPAEDVARITALALAFLEADAHKSVQAVLPEVVPLTAGAELQCGRVRVTTIAGRHTVPSLCCRFRTGASRASCVYSADTAPFPELEEFARGADLLIHEASYGASSAPAGDPWMHSGAPDAARAAAAAGVRRLALVHGLESQKAGAVAAAQAIFPDTFWPADGESVDVGVD